jgi:hypothetical protein
MLNLQIKNEKQFLLDGLKTDLESKIKELHKRKENASSSLEFANERQPVWSEHQFETWMKAYTIMLKQSEYDLEWYEKKYNELCLTLSA